MLSTLKKLGITYNSLNNRNTFTSGDVISGHVTLEVTKDCQIDSFYIKFKGKAEVKWTEGQGQASKVYHSKDKYFSVRQYFKDSSVVPPGIHVYLFSFQFPLQDIPSSFKGAYGKIIYLLEAILSRSMRMDSKESTVINFVGKGDLNPVPGLMEPQHESMDKKIKYFTSGSVAMDVKLEKSGFFPGEGLKVLAYIKNDSSREIKPIPFEYITTFSLLDVVLKINSGPTHLQVYLDVKYNSDTGIKFDIVIFPAYQVPAMATAPSAASDFGNGPYGNYGNPHPLVWGFGPPQPPAGDQPAVPPPPYETYGTYPSLNDFASKC
ncbi:arrestin domain-containing protein 3-like [Girardinichthys multiradiatus]|uniref:arrestin domain-containing protein 3-like n=1 Tax=Girardinichthys multiradiatus TaxID=208333 RepID=UPI001FAD529C|nr:arrestin domain-containing protein 3-like [Girardinichthys multiradiatus]